MTRYAIMHILVAVGLSLSLFLVIYIVSEMFMLSSFIAGFFFFFYISLIIFIENKDDIFDITLMKGAKKRRKTKIDTEGIKLKKSGRLLTDETSSENS